MEGAPCERLDPRALKAWFYSGLFWGLAAMVAPVTYLAHTGIFLGLEPFSGGWNEAGRKATNF